MSQKNLILDFIDQPLKRKKKLMLSISLPILEETVFEKNFTNTVFTFLRNQSLSYF